ncbi:MAG: arginine--tRNA ligase, partial [Phycisphaeraceae bacterium]|nr:arginine--tRNA ligase [Phycisphaeraceae bacterium]
VLGHKEEPIDVGLRPSGQPRFGDYQAGFAMSMGKKLGRPPRALAQAVVDAVDWSDLCEKLPEVAGPGFINFTLARALLQKLATHLGRDERLGVEPIGTPRIVVVDYSSPNVAKAMHVGHLRSTIIGDCLARVLGFLGDRVIRQNHIGDWGTQFGMLIQHMVEQESGVQNLEGEVGDLERLYQDAKRRFDAEPEFADRARARVVQLQAGDEETLGKWRKLVEASQRHFEHVYHRLGVHLGRDDVRGESFYNPLLAKVVVDLESHGKVKLDQGAKVVYPQGFKNPEGLPAGMIVQKSDGGYLYATTDLAAARYRIEELGGTRLVYVTDSRQMQHFAMVFQALREVGWAPEEVSLEHVPFGMVLGPDRKPFKTRSGDTIKLIDLLDEAIRRAGDIARRKNPELSEEQLGDLAKAIGIGAIKYADLSNQRIKDYVFDWDQMLAFDGNTAPYLQNAYVRIRSIFRKGGLDAAEFMGQSILLAEPGDRLLTLKLLEFGTAVEAVSRTLEPHRLCGYLYDLATSYHRFYEQCPVLTAETEDIRNSRLALSHLAARTLALGLDLLGIDVVERM